MPNIELEREKIVIGNVVIEGDFQLTDASKDILRDIWQSMEAYYFFKYGNVGPAVGPIKGYGWRNRNDLVGYTPHPDDPWPTPPWPWPWPLGPLVRDDVLSSALGGGIRDLGRRFADPEPQTNKLDLINNRAIHLEAAMSAMEKLDHARGQLKANIVALKQGL